MEQERSVVQVISMNRDGRGDRAEIVIHTPLPNGKTRSETRHVERKPDGGWFGNASDEVLRIHNDANKRLATARNALDAARNAEKKAAKELEEAGKAAAKNPSEKVRARANVAAVALKKAREAIGEAEKDLKKLSEEKDGINKTLPILVGYSLD